MVSREFIFQMTMSDLVSQSNVTIFQSIGSKYFEIHFKLMQVFLLGITPHIAAAQLQTRTDMVILAARNLVAALNDEKMPAEYPL